MHRPSPTVANFRGYTLNCEGPIKAVKKAYKLAICALKKSRVNLFKASTERLERKASH
ncbi:hypothetical protein CUTER_01445 [Corynebacterium uterequi]|uniref:Uncharacterized protein n=1 Tax=Corynebacterium uterequi TaxID=1072256 RepID=A0A0G3HEC2_9CORY|nr:hypothetical protein CUTER_01445 [Corynebacterium uterequi]